MPWYRPGTVSVTQNSNAVIGTGTAFIANSRVGDAFIGPDGRVYEVTNAASNTAISISPNYVGATTGAGTYAIAPMQGYVKDSADALRAYVNQFGAQLAALRTTGNYDVLPLSKGGTGVAVGSNADLLFSIGAMPSATAMPSVGGAFSPSFNTVRVISPAGAGAGLGNHLGWNEPGGLSGASSFVNNKGSGVGGFSFRSVNQDNTVGGPTTTITYEGLLDVPLGIRIGGVSVLERGSNANGNFLKLSDGTLICWYQDSFASACVSQVGQIFVAEFRNLSFPFNFISAPRVIPIAGRTSSTSGVVWGYLPNVAPSLSSAGVNIAGASLNATAFMGYVAIGSWR